MLKKGIRGIVNTMVQRQIDTSRSYWLMERVSVFDFKESAGKKDKSYQQYSFFNLGGPSRCVTEPLQTM